MAGQIKNSFQNGVNLDYDNLRLPAETSLFLKNVIQSYQTNTALPSNAGGQEILKPLEGNANIPITLPSGTNYCIGTHYEAQTNEMYFALYNASSNHSVWVIEGDTGVVQKVYQSSLLPFTNNPQNFWSKGRVVLQYFDDQDKYLIFTTNNNYQCFISVPDSIATNSYTTSFFTATAAFYNPVELIHITLPTPLSAIGLNTPFNYVPQTADAFMQNLLIRQGWQFRIKDIDVFNRHSGHGVISSNYITIVTSGCAAESNGLPRCVNLNFQRGNPLVAQKVVEYRIWKGNDRAGALATGWKEYDTIFIYDNASNNPWYSKPLNPLLTTTGSGVAYDGVTNIITYTFCADKGSIPIDEKETQLVQPDTPIVSGGVFPVKSEIGLYNNVRGFNLISPAVINQLAVTAVPPSRVPCDAAPLRTITVYISLVGCFDDHATVATNIIRQSFGLYVFGDSDGDGNGCTPSGSSTPGRSSSITLDQVFGDQQNPGFIGYIVGTNIRAISVQGLLEITGPTTSQFTAYPIGNPVAYNVVHQLTFRDVPASHGLIRIGSHKSTINDPDLTMTSTYVAGVVRLDSFNTNGARVDNSMRNPLKEIYFDCTAGDVNYQAATDDSFVIYSFTNGEQACAIDGYLYECPGGAPVEMSPVWSAARVGDSFYSAYTDHNGFYFAAGDSGVQVKMYPYYCGSPAQVLWNTFSSTNKGILHGDGTITVPSNCGAVVGYWRQQLYLQPSTFPAAARRIIKQQVVDCGTHIGIPGIPVLLTKCQPAITDSSGTATIIAHGRFDFVAYFTAFGLPVPYLASLLPIFNDDPLNNDTLILGQSGGCEWTTCSGCNFAIDDIVVTYLDCGIPSSGCTVTQPDRTLCLPVITALSNGTGISGVQSGQKYAFGFKFYDVIARCTDVQQAEGNTGFVSTPNLNDTVFQGSTITPIMALWSLQLVVPSGLTVPTNFTHMTVCISGGVLFEDFIDWSADWVQFVDNSGNTNTANPTAVRIYWPSLNEYNKKNNFQTNTSWQPIAETKTGNFAQADVVQFIMNGDGSWIPSVLAAPITYDSGGTFFTFDYQAEMSSLVNNIGQPGILTNGCLFRIIRPTQNQSGENIPLYEQSLVIPITGGVITPGTYAIPYVDSYMTQRQLPVPILSAIITTQTTINNPDATLMAALVGPKGSSNVQYAQYGLKSAFDGNAGAYGVIKYLASDGSKISVTLPEVIGSQIGPVSPGMQPTYPIAYSNGPGGLPVQANSYAGTNPNTNNIVLFSERTYPTSYPFFFETPSPSDFFASHLASRGRPGIVNTYEMQVRFTTEVALSNSFGNSNINGLGTFLSQNTTKFDRNAIGGITCVLTETGMCLMICEADWFITRFSQSQAQVNAAGQLLVQNADGSIFTAPQLKAGQNYGCTWQYANTIAKLQDYVQWLDPKGRLIRLRSLSEAEDVSNENKQRGIIGGYGGYLRNKIAAINTANLLPDVNGRTYFTAEIDPYLAKYILTSINFPVSGTPSYINTQSQPLLGANETMVIDLATGKLEGFASFTNEAYGMLPGYVKGKNFFSFKQGSLWKHHAGIDTPPAYANFNGVQCNCRITLVANTAPEKVKRYLWVEVYCRQNISGGSGNLPTALFLADTITTEAGQLSRLNPATWDIRDGYSTTQFLCDLNTPTDPNLIPQTSTNALFDGNPLIGRWLQASLVTQSAWAGTLFEVSSVAIYVNGVAKSDGTST